MKAVSSVKLTVPRQVQKKSVSGLNSNSVTLVLICINVSI